MRRLLVVTIVAFLGWSAYWAIASHGLRSGLETWIEARRAEAWQADYSDLTIRGFPNRVDASFENIALADPETGLAWSAPFFQLLALSYRPNHVIAVWPNQQSLATPQGKLDILSSKMQASVVVDATPNLALARSNFVTEGLTLQSDQGLRLSLDNLVAAMHKVPEENALYDIAYQIQGLAPPASMRNELLPEKMSTMDLDMRVGFDRDWDLLAISERRPQPTSITLRNANAVWGDLSLKAGADLTLDAGGLPTGKATLRITNWRQALQLARKSQQFNSLSLESADQFLALLAVLSGKPEDIDVTLRFANGTMLIGLIPIGPAPRFILR